MKMVTSEKGNNIRELRSSFTRALSRSFRRRSTADSAGTSADNLSSDDLLFIDLIKNQRWEAFVSGLSTTNLCDLDERFRASSEYSVEGSILHFALLFSPPFSVIKKITEELPLSLYRQDRHGRHPLHVAIANKTSQAAVGHIAGMNPRSCEKKDITGKTPLHMLFDREMDSLTLGIVETLVETLPASLEIEDENEMTALELAILNEAPLKIVMFLQRATRCNNRMQQQESKGIMRNDNSPSTEFNATRRSISSASA